MRKIIIVAVLALAGCGSINTKGVDKTTLAQCNKEADDARSNASAGQWAPILALGYLGYRLDHDNTNPVTHDGRMAVFKKCLDEKAAASF